MGSGLLRFTVNTDMNGYVVLCQRLAFFLNAGIEVLHLRVADRRHFMVSSETQTLFHSYCQHQIQHHGQCPKLRSVTEKLPREQSF